MSRTFAREPITVAHIKIAVGRDATIDSQLDVVADLFFLQVIRVLPNQLRAGRKPVQFDAAGYAGAKLVESKLDILYNDTPAMTAGKPHAELKPKWKEIVKARRFTITLNLHLGKATFRLLATDLTEGYVNYNKSE